jgi:hypothetical protein
VRLRRDVTSFSLLIPASPRGWRGGGGHDIAPTDWRDDVRGDERVTWRFVARWEGNMTIMLPAQPWRQKAVTSRWAGNMTWCVILRGINEFWADPLLSSIDPNIKVLFDLSFSSQRQQNS